jgi:ABC-type multidrug transport system fused ATPase/permease subunit
MAINPIRPPVARSLVDSLRHVVAGLAVHYRNLTGDRLPPAPTWSPEPWAPAEPELPEMIAPKGRVDFRNLSVSGCLNDFTATAEAGKRIAVVGPNDAGKSALLAAATRWVPVDSGQILLDGQDVSTHSVLSVRRAVGWISSRLLLEAGTIDSNLRARWPDAPDYAVEWVKAICRLPEILQELPQGGESPVCAGGTNLSYGQRQRIALARALLGNPAMLLLDEVDGMLDPASNRILDEILDSYPGTVLVVTHRYERARRADTLWHLENGRLLESGPPARLLAGDGPTARLFGTRTLPGE